MAVGPLVLDGGLNRGALEGSSSKRKQPKVFREFRIVKKKSLKQKADVVRRNWQKGLLVKIVGAKAASKDAQKALRTEKTQRSSIMQYIKALGHQLSLIGCPLSRFACKGRAPQPLRPGEKGAIVPYSSWPYPVPAEFQDGAHRIVLEGGDGKKVFELAEFAGGRRPLLSVCGDQGGSGLSSSMYLGTAKRMRSCRSTTDFIASTAIGATHATIPGYGVSRWRCKCASRSRMGLGARRHGGRHCAGPPRATWRHAGRRLCRGKHNPPLH